MSRVNLKTSWKIIVAGLIVGVGIGFTASRAPAQGSGGCPACPQINYCLGCGVATSSDHCCLQPPGSDSLNCRVDGCED